MAKIHEKILEGIREVGYKELSEYTGLDDEIFRDIITSKPRKYRENTIDILYKYFQLEQDEWYLDNRKKWITPSESILGDILKKKRFAKGMTQDQVAHKTKIDVRQIRRIEAGDSLPRFAGYTMTKLLQLYDFTREEEETIRWFITILKDIVIIHNKL